jgi:Poxvirus A32 protein
MTKINFYELTKREKVINPGYDQHKLKVPFRMLVAAPSGSGKGNFLMNLIFVMDQTFHEIIYCIRSGDEPLVNLLYDRVKGVRIYESGEVPSINEFSVKDDSTKKLKRIDKLQRLIIFDDLQSDKRANAMATLYYEKARKLGFSMIYIGQSYFMCPKNVRDNSTIFVLGRNILRRDLKMILQAFPTELTLDEFAELYREMTPEDLDVMIINIETRKIRSNIHGTEIQI